MLPNESFVITGLKSRCLVEVKEVYFNVTG